jgi:hypothetical protein
VSQVTVFSDHASLQWFLKMKEEKQGRVARWVIELQNHHHCWSTRKRPGVVDEMASLQHVL